MNMKPFALNGDTSHQFAALAINSAIHEIMTPTASAHAAYASHLDALSAAAAVSIEAHRAELRWHAENLAERLNQESK